MNTMIARLLGRPVEVPEPITPHAEVIASRPEDVTPENLRLLQEEIMQRQRILEARLRLQQRVRPA